MKPKMNIIRSCHFNSFVDSTHSSLMITVFIILEHYFIPIEKHNKADCMYYLHYSMM